MSEELAMVPGGKGGFIVPPWDSERARAAVRKRWEMASAAARRGLAKAGEQIPEINANSAPKVIEYLSEQHTLNAADPSSRNAVASFRQVMAVGYPKPERREVDSGSGRVGVDASDLADMLALFRAALAESPELRERLSVLRAQQQRT